ncbi:MAG TPA: DUF58 domain-containing protein [Myxococcaceae bacterium]|nr:DUF58 domain-containing protein [Myxococcaceae bacterium]
MNGRSRAALARLRRWLRPPRTLRVTRAGRTHLFLTLGIGLGALNTGNNLLYLVLGIQLATIVASGILSEMSLRGLHVRRLGADAAHAGEPFVYRWGVSRRSGTSFALTFAETHRELSGSTTLPILAAGEEVVVRALLSAPRRGPYGLSGVRVTTTFPLGLFVKGRLLDVPGELLVYPRRVSAPPVQPPRPGGVGDRPAPRFRRDGDGDTAGVRPLRDGEDARRVHWLKSAHGGQLLRVERDAEETRSVVLRLDVSSPGPALEWGCEQVAARARALLSSGFDVGLEAGPEHLSPDHGPRQERRLLRALACAGLPPPEAG